MRKIKQSLVLYLSVNSDQLAGAKCDKNRGYWGA